MGTRSVFIIGSIDEDTGATGPKPGGPRIAPPNGPPSAPNVDGVVAYMGNTWVTSRVPITRYTSTALSSLVNSTAPLASVRAAASVGRPCDGGPHGAACGEEALGEYGVGGGGGASLGALAAPVELALDPAGGP